MHGYLLDAENPSDIAAVIGRFQDLAAPGNRCRGGGLEPSGPDQVANACPAILIEVPPRRSPRQGLETPACVG